MIDIMMLFGTEVILVRVNGNDVRFGNTQYGGQMATIEGIKLSHSGVMKEFPELKDCKDWRMEAIARLKDKIRGLDSEEKVVEYVIEDLRRFGYVPKWKQRAGFRKEAIK